MGRAKDIVVKPIAARDANRIVKSLHYSGKVVTTSRVHFGVFLDGKCGGALQPGPSLDRRKLIGLVSDTKWNEFIELSRMAMADWLPRNGESRAIAVALRLLAKSYPHIKWVVSFADGCQCGDGTIYRASGFVLTGIRKNKTMHRLPTGEVIADVVTRQPRNDSTRKRLGYLPTDSWAKYRDRVGAECLPGYQLRYVYFLDPTARERLTVPIIPFSEIEKRGAAMYRGQPRVRSVDSDTSATHAGEGGAIPTRTL